MCPVEYMEQASMGWPCGLTGSRRLVVRILHLIPSVVLLRGFRTSSSIVDNTWYMTANSWLGSAYRTLDLDCRRIKSYGDATWLTRVM